MLTENFKGKVLHFGKYGWSLSCTALDERYQLSYLSAKYEATVSTQLAKFNKLKHITFCLFNLYKNQIVEITSFGFIGGYVLDFFFASDFNSSNCLYAKLG